MIPMDEVAKEFELHLKSHPRTILSARFGDGKSTFLAAAEKKLQNRYVFLTLFDYITLNVPPVALSIVPLQKRSL